MKNDAAQAIEYLQLTLDLIDRILPEDEVWEQVSALVEKMDALTKDKLVQRENVLKQKEMWANLDSLIKSIQNDLANELEYHEIPFWQHWSACNLALFSREDAEKYTGMLEDLRSYLESYAELRNKRPASISEEKRISEEKFLCGQKIYSLANELESLFVSSSHEPSVSFQETEPEPGPAIEPDPIIESGPDNSNKETATFNTESKRPEDDSSKDLSFPCPSPSDMNDIPSQPREDHVQAVNEVENDSHEVEKNYPDTATSGYEEPASLKDLSDNVPQAAQKPVEGDAKVNITVEERTQSLESMLWEAVASNNYAKAYWLAQAGAALNDPAAPPPWILSAMYYARYAGQEEGAVAKLYSIIYEHPTPLVELIDTSCSFSPEEAGLLVAIAASIPAILTPSSAISNWLLSDQQGEGLLGYLIGLIANYSYAGISLREAKEELQTEQQVSEKKERLQRCVDEAKEWLSKAICSKKNYAPATNLLHYLVSEQTELGRIARLVAGNHVKRWAEVERFIQSNLGSRKRINEYLSQVYKEMPGTPVRREIEGKALKQLSRELEDLQNICFNWKSLAASLEEGQKSLTFQDSGGLVDFKAKFTETFSQLQHWLDEVSVDPRSSYRLRVIVEKARETFFIIQDLLMGKEEDEVLAAQLDSKKQLIEPLLLLSSYPLEKDEYEELPENLTEVMALDMLESYRRGNTLAEAFDWHIGQKDFLAAKHILEIIRIKEDDEFHRLWDLYEDTLMEEKGAFKRRCTALRKKLEQATIDHVLTESEKAYLEANLFSLERMEKEDSLKICNLLGRIDEISNQIDELKIVRKNSLQAEFENIQGDIVGLDGDIKERAGVLCQKIATALSCDDLALVDEYLIQLEGLIRFGRRDILDNEQEEPRTKYLEQYLNVYNELQTALNERGSKVHDYLASGKVIGGLDTRKLPAFRYKEIEKALKSFQALRSAKNSKHLIGHLLTDHVKNIIEYLGFLAPRLEVKSQERAFCHLELRVSTNHSSPIPEFGSTRRGVYQILLLWERPAAQTIGQIIEHTNLESSNPIIIFLGRLTQQQNKEWADYCRSRQLTALLIDEIILCFLATQRQDRFLACVSCAMPFGYANPYSPFGAGNVPQEMFKGRQEIVKGIMAPNGPAVIFGGRQLGKSAILRRVEDQFNDPTKKQYVYYDDIRNLGSPNSNQMPEDIWERLGDWFRKQDLLPSKNWASHRHLQDDIIQLFEQISNLHILILLDEADKFLEADSKKDFEEVSGLKRIMDATSRRFKVVFCGLHGVQRYSFMPNHPFAHLEKVNLGPLEGRAARALIEEPLEVLGYELEEAAVFRILAYTNYHPALIQHFCRELLKYEISMKRLNSYPRYKITMDSVEAVYRNPDVRKEMNDRFVWTVGLDDRYEVLVYSMILDQLTEYDGYRKEYNYEKIVEMARDWWSNGFNNISLEHGRSLLDELVGLGVLVKMPQKGTYRLRNANTVRALGTKEEIEARLLSFADRSAPSDHVFQSLHRLDAEKGIWSPLTIAQESYLLKRKSLISLIFASEALGYRHLKEFLKQITGDEKMVQSGAFIQVPEDCNSLSSVLAFIKNSLKGAQAGRVVFQASASQLAAFEPGLLEVLGIITDNLQKLEQIVSRERLIHFWVTFNAGETVDWYLLPQNERKQTEEKINTLLTASRWDSEMIRNFLKAHHMLSTNHVSDELQRETGGWPMLLGELLYLIKNRFETIPDGLDPRSMLGELMNKIQADQKIRNQFVEDLGLAKIKIAPNILSVLMELESEAEDDFVQFIAGELNESEATIRGIICAMIKLGVIDEKNNVLKCEPVAARLVLQ